jgi:hypothetical protein
MGGDELEIPAIACEARNTEHGDGLQRAMIVSIVKFQTLDRSEIAFVK